jgi:hypothetical protein
LYFFPVAEGEDEHDRTSTGIGAGMSGLSGLPPQKHPDSRPRRQKASYRGPLT